MGNELNKNVQIRANVNGQELSAQGVAEVLNALFREGWLDDVIQTALGVQSASMERAKMDLRQRMKTLKDTLQQAVNAQAGVSSQASEKPETGEGASS